MTNADFPVPEGFVLAVGFFDSWIADLKKRVFSLLDHLRQIFTSFGGPLSHSSIVAREYGIPAVLGTGGLSKIIKSGQTITVDADNSVVIIEDTEVE